ncbi:DNA repair exonuclease SbcCD ATPase subunit [Rhodobacter sp. JA431]|uniref:AAA family ATPase n=1 Tax=Rhodobacter sp. JA431 TaxID=570013 RepID=UPI000BC46DAE|nr:ATP-binding protein [Rhodobacter sp. JA431]SOB99476.1 DNA repair exonuclease SbcCD ATPase subunit [Rhodobacter sp. JA431]
MKLRAIELSNIRRFAGQRARLSGLGDGLTVLSEPNEFGKSTFFDALHAVFFERHRASGAAVKSLRPHAGGAPEASVEVELPTGRYTIFKRWLSRPQARITEAGGRIIAQDDEAEAWIEALMQDGAGSGGLAGPSGLVWVRQGLLGLEPEGTSADERRARERGLNTRRDLLSSVAGEIEAMTGGRRMDAVVARVVEDLAPLVTATGKPKSGGAWATALAEVESLAKEIAELRPKAERLSGDLARRGEVQRQIARLTDPAEAQARAEAVKAAKAAYEAAQAHAAQLAQSETALRLAQNEEAAANGEISRLTQLQARLTELAQARDAAETKAEAARQRAEELAGREGAARQKAEASAHILRDLRARLGAAQKAQLARAAAARAEALAGQVKRAESLQQEAEQITAKLGLMRISPKALQAAEEAQAALDRLTVQAELQAVQISAHPTGGGQALLEGVPLGAGPHPVLAACEITLPGFGSLYLDPGAKRGAETAQRLDQARGARDAALAACGAESLSAARHLLNEAQRLREALKQITASLADVAPKGAESLRADLARAQAEATQAPQQGAEEDIPALEVALAQADEAASTAQAEARTAQDLASTAREARAGAEAARLAQKQAHEAAQQEAGDPQVLAERLAALRAELPKRAQATAEKAQAHQVLTAAAPDLATAEARLARATSAAEQARQEVEEGRRHLAELDTRISVLAEEGIEERLADLEGRHQEAEARAGRYEGEVKALIRLRVALEAARSAAREAYFEPVMRELKPLLSILHPGAEIEIDDQTLLPSILTREGEAESLDILSGGTREQLAILTRLAFARLFAQAGHPVPVILDDALVMSDDDRIEAMFTALHRVARDQQIIVFTCRQRAFAQLGGAKAQVTVEAL